MMGLMQWAMGMLRMGFMVHFLSKPVIGGFTSAAALLIGLNQLPQLGGVDCERSNQMHLLCSKMHPPCSQIQPSVVSWLSHGTADCSSHAAT